METIKKEIAGFKLLENSNNGKIFFVEFKKKDGSFRRMTCRRSVKKNLTGKGMAYKPLDKGLMTVYDMDIQEYRMINLAELTKFTVNKIKYIVE